MAVEAAFLALAKRPLAEGKKKRAKTMKECLFHKEPTPKITDP